MNTTLFICLFFSVIIAIKATNSNEHISEELNDENTTETEVEEVLEEEEEEKEEIEKEEVEEVEKNNFEYMPSIRLMEMEKNLLPCEMVFVKEGMVKETIMNVFSESMTTPEAKGGSSLLIGKWKTLLEGPEASRVVDTFGKNFNKIITTNKDANILNVAASTVHTLLNKAAVENRATGLSTILKMVSTLIKSEKTPEAINKVGKLVIAFVQKSRVSEFTRKFFEETLSLLDEKNINNKLDKYFSTIISMMKSTKLQKLVEAQASSSKPSPQ